MIRTRKTKELGEILALLHLDSFTLRQKKNKSVWGVCYSAGCVEGFIKVHYFAPFQNCWNVREKRQRAIQGVREVVETASDKMSAAPELNPGD